MQSPQELQVSSSLSVPANTVPRERTSGEKLITDDAVEARKLSLTRGQYRVVFEMPFDGHEKSVRDELRKLRWAGEFKRVYFYKLDVVDTGRVVPEHIEGAGQKIAQVTAVFHVLDNPIPLIPIVWGAAIVGGGLFSWLTIKELNVFTERAAGQLLLIAGAIIGIYYAVFR